MYLGQAKVRDNESASSPRLLVDEYVFWFQITVSTIDFVHEGHAVEQATKLTDYPFEHTSIRVARIIDHPEISQISFVSPRENEAWYASEFK
jgi:hypothetical protein